MPRRPFLPLAAAVLAALAALTPPARAVPATHAVRQLHAYEVPVSCLPTCRLAGEPDRRVLIGALPHGDRLRLQSRCDTRPCRVRLVGHRDGDGSLVAAAVAFRRR